MVMEILCVEPIYPQYSGVLETCLALRYWFFEVLGSEIVKLLTEQHLEFLSLNGGCTGLSSHFMSKCHFVGNLLLRFLQNFDGTLLNQI